MDEVGEYRMTCFSQMRWLPSIKIPMGFNNSRRNEGIVIGLLKETYQVSRYEPLF
jgi:hypothetical protein